MGRSERNDSSTADNPMDRSTSDLRDGGQSFPTTFTTEVSSRKKWIALGLSVFLILVLLIAIIILATAKTPTPPPPCPKETESDADFLSGNDAFQIGESKSEGIEPATTTGIDELKTGESQSKGIEPATTTEKDDFGDWNDDDWEEDFIQFPIESRDQDEIEEIGESIEKKTTPKITTESSTTSFVDPFDSELDEIHVKQELGEVHVKHVDQDEEFIQGREWISDVEKKEHINEGEASRLAQSHEVNADDMAELLFLTKEMSKEDQRTAIIEKFGNSPDVINKLKDLMAGKVTLTDDGQELVVAARNVQLTKDLHTPDDNHVHHGEQDEQKRKFALDVISKFLEFANPNTGEKEEAITVGGFYGMVEALIDILKEINEETTSDSIEDYLKFMESLRRDIEMLNKTQLAMDIKDFYNNSAIEKVNRLWADYVSNSNSIVFAKIQQELKEVGVKNLNTSLSKGELHKMKQLQLEEKLEKTDFSVLDGQRSALSCDNKTELMCEDGLGCYSISRRCDRYVDCIYDQSDEKNCTCRLYLEQGKICDGYPDCPDNSDELGCFCQSSQHYCGLQDSVLSKCIENDLRCDNVIDCESSSDEMNCLALGQNDKFQVPRQETKGLLHIQRSNQWYVFGVDIKDDENYQPLLRDLAQEVCVSTLTRGRNEPNYTLVDLEDPQIVVAHLKANFDMNNTEGLDRFYSSAGRFQFSILPPFSTTKAVSVNCGQPQCGQSVNEGSGPFAVFNQILNYQESSDEEASTRIVGGKNARPTKWPFSLSLHRNGYFKCGASIIAPQWILTAAHCVYNFIDREDYFEVRGGVYRQRSDASTETVRKLEKIFIHPDYDDSEILHDIALAKLDRPFNIDSFTATVCLPETENVIETTPQSGDWCYAVGWGLLDDGANRDVADTLQEVQVPILENCDKKKANESMYICGGFEEGGHDTCQGDSGGPLFCRDMSKDDESWYLAGVISHGKGCALPNEPSFYTRVAFYKPWIQDIISGKIEPRTNVNSATECPSGVSCDNGRCIGEAEICDFHNDCFDGLDEIQCQPAVVNGKVVYEFKPWPVTTTKTTTTTSKSTTTVSKMPHYYSMTKGGHKDCKPGSFICKNVRQCISEEQRCDLKADCIDGSDERDCLCRDYFSSKAPHLVCDGFPDCFDFSDELGCQRCNSSSDFYCHLSNRCIDKSKVCDEKYDCHFQEDERYCMALSKNDFLNTDVSGKPNAHSKGYIAVNYKGNWRFICVAEWRSDTSDTICQYLGYVSSHHHEMVPNSIFPHLQVGTLPVSHVPHKMYRRDTEDTPAISGRQASCKFVSLSCKSSRTCGQLPLYSSLGQETPIFGPGVTPWKAEIYVEGVHTCGATLVNPRWLLTHRSCAEATMPSVDESLPEKYAVARLGAYRDTPELNFLSGHEQVIRIARSLIIPDSDIALIKLETEAELTEHVHTICLPSTEWVPTNAKCFIHGRHSGVFNHAVETKVIGKCNQFQDHFDICTKQQKPTGECLDNWSGTLVCPDFSGNLYAVGIYHSGPESACQNGAGNIPDEYISIVSDTAREAIISVVQANAGQEELTDDCPTLRCPLGACLNKTQLCDGIPDCEDASDEKSEFCTSQIEMCEQVNATHCSCALDNMMCDNLMCLHKSKFCDGINDCGDNSDEPANCENDCSLALNAYSPDQICDKKIDCVGQHDLANDESVENCCSAENTLNNYRCALGHHPGNVSISDECIPRKCVCDWDVNEDECPSCMNGADETDCMSIHGHKSYGYKGSKPKTPDFDAFGRSKTQREGYVYFTAHGQDFLYCASIKIFTKDRIKFMGQALCQHENFDGLRAIELHDPFTRTKINPSYVLPENEQVEFDTCRIIFLSCI